MSQTSSHTDSKTFLPTTSIETFLEALASPCPVPGGGGASALVGALASALAEMNTRLSSGKKAFEPVQAELDRIVSQLDCLRNSFLDLINRDAEAYKKVALALKLPRSTQQEELMRQEALETSLVEASEVPLELMCRCRELLLLCETLSRIGSKFSVSDAGVGASFALAAARGSSLTVFVNLRYMSDTVKASKLKERCNTLFQEIQRLEENCYQQILKRL